MIERMHAKKMVNQFTVIYEEIVCDHCHKIIRKQVFDNEKGKLIDISESRDDYYHVVTGHNDWGNDSVDSVNNEIHCCSPSCVRSLLENYLAESHNSRNTNYISFFHHTGEDLDA